MTDTQTADTETRPWRITWRGQTWAESDLTGQHLATLALLAGRDDWDTLEVDPRNGHQRLMMMISALLAVSKVEGVEFEDAADVASQVAESVAEVSKAPVDEILGALTQD